jgi:hypothetical protein
MARWLKASGSLYQFRAYNVKHDYNVNEFLEAYRLLLQKAVDEVWVKIRWIEKYDGRGERGLFQ